MKILIDIGHPAHVHYYKNFIKIMQSKGHEFFITARDREFVRLLLKNEGIEFSSRGKGAKTKIGKILYMIKADFIVFWHSMHFKPDIYISHCSIFISHVAFLLNKPCIFTGDTDSTTVHKYLIPLINALVSPSCFKYNYGKKHVFFNSYMELMFLHPNYFKSNIRNIQKYLSTNNKKNVLLRFVSWEAHHDKNLKGISDALKKKLINELKPYCNIFISSEKELSQFFQPFQTTIPPYLIHDFYGKIDFFIGESATMASECAIMGVPAIYFDGKGRGYTDEQEEEYGLVFNFKTPEGIIEKAVSLASNENLRESYNVKRDKLLKDKIDPTSFLVWFIENYPESHKTMKENPEFQNRFKA